MLRSILILAVSLISASLFGEGFIADATTDWTAIKFEELDEAGTVEKTLMETYHYDSVEDHRWYPGQELLTLCKNGTCDFAKVVAQNTISKEAFIESILLQNRAANQNLALPILHMGSISDKFYFFISVKGDTNPYLCKKSIRSGQFFIDALAAIGIAHSDLDDGRNTLCLGKERYVIDFDCSHDLKNLDDSVKKKLLALERYCTLPNHRWPLDTESLFEKNDLLKPLKQAFGPSELFFKASELKQACICRKKNVDWHRLGYNCAPILQKLLSSSKKQSRKKTKKPSGEKNEL